MAIQTWTWRALWAGTAVLSATLGACKGEDPINRYCTQLFACDCQPAEYPTVSQCGASLRLQATLYSSIAQSAGLVYDESCMVEAADRVEAVGCRSADELIAEPGACSVCALAHGDKPIGAACMTTGDVSDCDQHLTCINDVCRDPCARIAVGKACTDDLGMSFGTCVDDSYCDFATRLCVALAGEGKACPNGIECKAGLACVGGTCEGPPGDGEACPTGVCAEGLACIASACRPAPGVGESCANGFVCAEGAFCSQADQRCYPVGGIGDPCLEQNGCAAGGYCGPNNVCTDLPAAFCSGVF